MIIKLNGGAITATPETEAEARMLLSMHTAQKPVRRGVVVCNRGGKLYQRKMPKRNYKKLCDVCGRSCAGAIGLGIHKKVHEKESMTA